MKDNLCIYSDYNKDEYVSFYATEELIHNYDLYESYIKSCEYLIRNDKRYSDYIHKIKSSGLNKCVFFGELKEEGKVKVEMHHGPIFTLFDICDIVLKYLFNTGCKKITTYKIADIVLTEHENDNIQIVMLNSLPHKGKHNHLISKKIFIQIKSSFGRIDRFIEKYNEGMEEEHFDNIEKYIRLCKKHMNNVDNGLFNTSTLLSFNKK